MAKPNQDIRDYMADHSVTQKQLAEAVGTSIWTICTQLKTELSQKDKEMYLNMIDSIVADRNEAVAEDTPIEESEPIMQEQDNKDVSCSTKFKIGDRVKILSKSGKIGTVTDIWHSLAKAVSMYAVENEDDGYCSMYAEEQLEPAPIPTDYSFDAHIDGNVAVVTMTAKQGDKTWIYARGHAHILHDGEVGMAQAVSFAARRMFESLDRNTDKPIYFNQKGTSDDHKN